VPLRFTFHAIQPTLIPPKETIEELRIANGRSEEELEWILVVEKDVSRPSDLLHLIGRTDESRLVRMFRPSSRLSARSNSVAITELLSL
jgi:hypothetical protein